MDFEKILAISTAAPIQLPVSHKNLESRSNPPRTQRDSKKREGSGEIMKAAENQKRRQEAVRSEAGTERLLVHSGSDPEGLGESRLTPEERRVVADIARLFNSKATKPSRLLVRLNQTQPATPADLAALQSRLQRIEITRLDEEDNFTHLPTQLTLQEELPSKGTETAHENASDASSIRIHNSVSSLEGATGRLGVSKQVSMMYVPELNMSTLIGMKNAPTLFNRFNRRQEDSVGSNFSQDFTEAKVKEEGHAFVKLLEIDLFLKRKEMQLHRSEELRQANERMLAAHLADKELLERNRLQLEHLQRTHTTTIDQLTQQLQEQRAANARLQAEAETREKSLASAKALNEQYLKENNDLKAKAKEYLKVIHELKAELASKDQIRTEQFRSPLETITDRKAVPKLCFQQKSSNETARYNFPQSPRKEVTFNELHQHQALNSQLYESSPYFTGSAIEQKFTPAYERERQTQGQGRNEPTKLSNCHSQGLLNQAAQGGSDKKEKQQAEPTSRSQKAVGIRKNNFNQQPISPSTRNLVRVNKNAANDGSILLPDKLRDNKSLSSYSNLSGKSLSQRIGFVSKPTVDHSRGMLVDYMIEEPIPERTEERREPKEHFKFRRNQ